MRNFLLLGILLAGGPRICRAQLDNQAFLDSIPVSEVQASRLGLHVDYFGYFRNNEYFNPVADGYTLFGQVLQPTLRYGAGQKVTLEGGVLLRQEFGQPGLADIAPVLRVKVRSDSLTLLFGTLEGHLHHRLVEPLLDFERVITNRLENGFQARYSRKWLWADLWVDWQRNISRESVGQEQIAGGLSVVGTLTQGVDWEVSLPAQVTLRHRGGQVGTIDEPGENRFNAAVGLRVARNLDSRWLRRVWLEPYLVKHADYSTQRPNPLNEGRALYVNGGVTTRWFTLLGSYWRGRNFRSPQGGSLFQSYNAFRPDTSRIIEPDRHLLLVRLLRDFKISERMYVTFRFEPVVDLNTGTFEFSHGLYFNFRPDFRLKQIPNDSN